MHFKINKDIFLQNLLIVQRALAVKTPLPVLTCLKFEVDEKTVNIIASNSNSLIKAEIKDESLQIKKPGVAAIPGRFLVEIVRKIDSQTIELETIGGQSVKIIADRSEFNLRLMDQQDYPNVNIIEGSNYKMDVMRLQTFIRQTNFSAGDDEKNLLLTGVNVYNKSKQVVMVATNGYRLSEKRVLTKGAFGDFDVVIPKSSLDELSKILDTTSVKEIDVVVSNTHILFNFLNISFQTRLFEGRFPATEPLIPKEFLIEIPFNKNDLLATIERVSLFSPKEKSGYNVVTLSLQKDKTVLIESINNEIGEATEQIIPNGNVIGDTITVTFSSKYVVDALKSFVSHDIVMKFVNNKKPFIIEGLQDENLTQLILPVHKE